MIATETAKTIVLILFGLAILWIVIIIVKNDTETIVRAILVAAVLGLGLYYLNTTKLETLSFAAIKRDLFPVQARAYVFKRQDAKYAGRPATNYIFEDPGPPLSLVMAEGGKYMAIRDVEPINVLLEYIGLPPVAEGVPELASITGSVIDAEKFRWDDYEKGVLVITRGLCRDMASAKTFPCVAQITLISR
jgi:hypothetical protein